MDQRERDYFAMREQIERAAAKNAASDAAKLVHEQLAHNYHELASGTRLDQGKLTRSRGVRGRTAGRDEVAPDGAEPDLG